MTTAVRVECVIYKSIYMKTGNIEDDLSAVDIVSCILCCQIKENSTGLFERFGIILPCPHDYVP